MVEMTDMSKEELLVVIEIKDQIINDLKDEIANYQELVKEILDKKD
ncbi:MAG TPA: hypothetical protein VFD00_02780 [Thermoclostridium sp.]|nr:hypothetical protein [Thermoclostridium sp.]